jgi:hypothetical protein
MSTAGPTTVPGLGSPSAHLTEGACPQGAFFNNVRGKSSQYVNSVDFHCITL